MLTHGMQLRGSIVPRLPREPELGLVPCSLAHAQPFDSTAGGPLDDGHVAQ